ncbi:hypothetical protein RhiirB3_442347 [Rhizophagus irregularis]|nr:hypothetical protein RhiirB3_442347 [Rhizophagus irregularis]
MSNFFLRADATDFENIYLGYDDKNNFSNLSLITPTHSRVPTVLNTPTNDKILSPPIVLPTRNPLFRPTRNTKAAHVNLIYDRWKSCTKKTVTSNRLGISYQESIHARDVTSVLVYGNKHMYRKCLSNFQLQQSKHAAVKKKQEIRFLRACRRVFKTKEQNPPDLHRHRLRAAHRYHFLFLKSQYVNKLVKHLIYNHGLVSDNYGFYTPHYYKTMNHVTSRADGHPIATRHARLTSVYPTSADTGDYIVPGSRTWFTYMSELHRSNPNDNDGTLSNIRKDTTLSDASDETSDDTKDIERHPKKCNDVTVTNNLFYRNKDRYKRNRPSEVPIDSTAVAGPSWI